MFNTTDAKRSAILWLVMSNLKQHRLITLAVTVKFHYFASSLSQGNELAQVLIGIRFQTAIPRMRMW